MLSTRTIYVIGTLVWGLSMFGAAFGLSKAIESRLYHNVQTQLAHANLRGFDVHLSGQSVTLSLRPDGMDAMSIHTSDDLNRATTAAAKAVYGVDDAFFGAKSLHTPMGGALMGPITQVRFDEAGLANARLKLNAPPSAKEMAIAASCTEDVALAVGQRKLNFISDSAQLTPDSAAIIDDIFESIQSCPEKLDLYVEGYTDNSGTAEHNLKLSQARAEAASAALIAKGLRPEDVHAKGFGVDKPLATNDDADGQAQNRRVEFILRPR